MIKLFVIGALPYFSLPWVREACHAVKEGDQNAIEQQARRLESFVRKYSLLVPVPGHRGRAKTMKKLSHSIAKKAKHNGKLVIVTDLLKSEPHESLNTLKHRGGWPITGDVVVHYRSRFGAMLIHVAEALGFKVYLVDNVVDSGVTIQACYRAIGPHQVLAIGRTENWKKNPDIKEMVVRPSINFKSIDNEKYQIQGKVYPGREMGQRILRSSR